MHYAWNKGLRKETSDSVAKTSKTMRDRKIDNFKSWREESKRKGKIKSHYPDLEKNGDLAEFIGVMLGDGHIESFPRTQRIILASNIHNTGFIIRYANLMERLFEKKPTIWKQKDKACMRIGFYEGVISERLGIPSGSRKNFMWVTPEWIKEDKNMSIRFLRGLFEAEGSESHHSGTYTHKLSFSNLNKALLDTVFELLCTLGFHPTQDSVRVQLSRKEEVCKAVELLEFRKY